jgi:hypothetical protein
MEDAFNCRSRIQRVDVFLQAANILLHITIHRADSRQTPNSAAAFPSFLQQHSSNISQLRIRVVLCY